MISSSDTSLKNDSKLDNEYLEKLKKKILNLTEIEWHKIYNLLIENNVPLTKNSNGIFVNMSHLNVSVINKINEYNSKCKSKQFFS